MRSQFLSLAYLASTVSAFALWAPQETSVYEHNLLNHAEAPEPTKGPQIPQELFRRDTTGTVLVAGDNTCGYLGGLSIHPFYCPFTDSCLFVTATSASVGNVACCPPVGDCGIRAGCVDYKGYWSSSSCNSACMTNIYILKCTALSLPYCNSVIFPENSVTDYFCDDSFAGSFQTAFTTYIGQTSGGRFQTETVTLTDSSSTTKSGSASGAPRSSATGGGSAAAPSSGAGSAQSTAGFAIPIGSAAANPDVASSGTARGSASPTAGSASASSSSAAPVSSSNSSTPVGAIVGGVVGGVGGLALIGAGLFFFFRHRRHHDAANNPPEYGAGQATTGPNGGYPGPGGAAVGAGSAYAASGAKPPGQPYPPQEMAQNNPSVYPPAAELYGQKNPQQTGQYSPASPMSQPSGPTSPGYLGAAGGAYPDHVDATSPVSGHSGGAPGTDGPVSELGSPPQSYQGTVPAPHPGTSEMSGMSANMAGRFPTDLHYGTHEMVGSEIQR